LKRTKGGNPFFAIPLLCLLSSDVKKYIVFSHTIVRYISLSTARKLKKKNHVRIQALKNNLRLQDWRWRSEAGRRGVTAPRRARSWGGFVLGTGSDWSADGRWTRNGPRQPWRGRRMTHTSRPSSPATATVLLLYLSGEG
jgi:hypothetical protein